MQGKYWVFTLNNYTDEEYISIKDFKWKYLIIGREVGEQGTPHLQGYAEYSPNIRIERLKKINNRAHWEKRRGTAAQAADYCKKEGNFEEWGEISKPEPGRRTDIEEIREMVAAGRGMKEIVDVATSFQSLRFAEKLISYKEAKRSWKPYVVWLHGPTGCGKTRRAMEEAVDPWISGKNLKWWEGYDAHEHVIIDDFRADFCTFHELLRILDRYPYTVEVKGGSRQLLARKIWVTSCYKPDQVYQTREDIGQLLRRIDQVIGIGIGTEVGGNTQPLPPLEALLFDHL